MEHLVFDGQQEGERILYTITPHIFSKYIAVGKLVFLSIFLMLMTFLISSVVQDWMSQIRVMGIILSMLLLSVGIWWNSVVYKKARAYITDRRIIRFDVVSPFFQTKRVLFWNEALKAKAFAPNLVYRLLKIGTIQVEPLMADHEDVRVTDAYYFEDLANYIDKILFTFKNKPEDIPSLRPFVPKPRGHRG